MKRIILGVLISVLSIAGLAGCPAHDGMTTQQTINYHCEKNDHGARWLAGYGDGSSQLNNLEDEQYRLQGTPDDRCYGGFTRLDGYRVIIGYDVNYYNEQIQRVWIAAIYNTASLTSSSVTLSDYNLTASPDTAGAISCFDTTDAQKASAQAAGVTLPPDCTGQTLPPGGHAETVSEFLALNPEDA